MADENELVTVAKPGEPKLKILFAHLAEHVRLGWKHVEDVMPEMAEDDIKTDDADDSDKKDDSKGGGKKASK